MYTNFFRLSEPPFSLTPDPRYLYMSEKHREGLAHLIFGVQQPGGFIQLTGEIGCGKTTLCRCLVSQLPEETDIALILNPRMTAIELLASFCDELSIPCPAETASVKILIDAINRYLLESHAKGRRTVLVIDEAQNLHRDVLEQIRLLTNLETEQEKLLQIILIGQPELLKILEHPSLRQLAQRITARYHLLPLSRLETSSYIQHRLFVAGLSAPVFTKRALSETFRLTGGVPRLINIICDRALLGAYTLDKRRVSRSIIRKATKEIGAPNLRSHRRLLMYACGIVVFLILLGAAVFSFGPLGINRLNMNILEKQTPIAITESGNDAPAPTDLEAKDSRKPDEAILENTENISAGSEVYDANAEIPRGVPEGKKSLDLSSSETFTSEAQSIPFDDLISAPSLQNSLALSFNHLYSTWDIPVQIQPWEMGCAAGYSFGFECLFMTGDWLKIRRLDIPVIMSLQLPQGETRHITLVGLSGSTATVAISTGTYSFPVQDIDRFWDGSFILIWKPPFDALLLTQGMQGPEIAWARQILDAYEGMPESPSSSSLFDEELRKRIVLFQKTHLLIPDGRIGPETLLRLSLVLNTSSSPLLSQ